MIGISMDKIFVTGAVEFNKILNFEMKADINEHAILKIDGMVNIVRDESFSELIGERMLWLEGILLWLLSSVILLIVTLIMYIMILVNFLHTKESAYLILFLFWVVKFIVVGKLADSIYWRKIKKRINAAHGEDEKQSKLKQLANGIECKGVSIWSAVIMFILLKFGDVLVGTISVFMAIMISCLR